MQFMPTTFDTVNNDAAYTDYLPQENVISNFSNELDTAMAEAQYENNMPMDKESEDKVFDKEAENSSPYTDRAEIYSFFVPQEPRFSTEELSKLAKAFQNDDICIEAQNALASLMNTPTGPTLKDLLSTLPPVSRAAMSHQIPMKQHIYKIWQAEQIPVSQPCFMTVSVIRTLFPA